MRLILKRVRVHNLKGIDLELESGELIVFTGVSGSGKSSLAFDTIYTEGQRRYIESMSTFSRRHLGDFAKPDADVISGISPTIAIEQKTAGRSPRSTVGTMTGIYDFMRVLFARAGDAFCPVSGERVSPLAPAQIVEKIGQSGKIMILAPYVKGRKGEFKDELAELLRRGFTKVRFDGKIVDISDGISVDPNVSHDLDVVIDRITLPDVSRLNEAVSTAIEVGRGVMSVFDNDVETLYSTHAFAQKSGLSYPPLEPQDFSFNHPSGMCPACQGLGIIQEFNLDLIINPDLSVKEDCCTVAPSYNTVRYGNIYDNLARLYKFDTKTPWKKLPEAGKSAYLYGIDAKWTKMVFVHPVSGKKWVDYVKWRGVLFEAKQRYSEAKSDMYRDKMHELMTEGICHACHGTRLKPYPAAAQFHGKKISEITAMSIGDAHAFFSKLKTTPITDELIKEITERLQFLIGVGLHYITLERSSPTLSGGEAQRVRLAAQIGSGLVGSTYILDEPSIGLHPSDNAKLLETLKRLRDRGNTVIVVEHDEETILNADFVVDIGPLAGALGGEVIVAGSVDDLLKNERSITGGYLSGRLKIPIPEKRRKPGKEVLKITGATHHNLKKITAEIPLGLFVAVTGVSGSGKSSLISDTLYPALSNHLHASKLAVGKHTKIEGLEFIDKVIAIDQSPIGRTPRSNPATYIKVFDEIRDLYARLPESQAFGYSKGRFSFNVKEGSCPHCSGMGMVKIDMDFMEDEWVLCPHCEGHRFDTKTLSVLYKGKNIYDVLEMPIKEALLFFESVPPIAHKLSTLIDVGLDYIKLGQPSPTLSGGEAQRIKLAKELARPSTGKTLYILDEPTTGLHFHDIHKLINVLQSLISKGNTVLVIEHNMDLVRAADYLIELGPEGGDAGGQLMAVGTPEELIKKKSATGLALSHKSVPAGKRKRLEEVKEIVVTGATQNNLKGVSAKIPRGKISVCTGPSGSGKTSFAFETIFAEGQRRYTESLSSYARQFIKQMPKPKLDHIDGLSPAIAIEQKSHAGNPRSTVGTMTEGYDFLRVLYAHMGVPHSPETKQPLKSMSRETVLEELFKEKEGARLFVLSPLPLKKGEEFPQLKARLQSQGFLRIRLNGAYFELDQDIPYLRGQKNDLFLVIDRLILGDRKRLDDAIDQAVTLLGPTFTVEIDGKDRFFNLTFADPTTGKSYPPITPHSFSFNTEQGMCPDCLGLGVQYGIDFAKHPDILKLSPMGLFRLLCKDQISRDAADLFASMLKKNVHTPLHKLSRTDLQALIFGSLEITRDGLTFHFMGLSSALSKLVKVSGELRDLLEPLLKISTCLSCEGTRLNPLARHVKIKDLTIAGLCALPLDTAIVEVNAFSPPPFLKETHAELVKRLQFLQEIGLGYLSLDRSAPTLSGGETQRIRLARGLGSGLTGCLYVLDEPTIGLHPKDNDLLNQALKKLRDLGNTLLLVEHDPLTISIADHILDFGPGAGQMGGRIVASGTLAEIKKNPDSLTGAYLSGRKKVPIPEKRRKPKKWLELKNCSLHNLKNVNAAFPLECFTCVTGVSGSGKSTLVTDILKPHVEADLGPFDKLISIDQNPLGQTIRADVTTYTDLAPLLRMLFAQLPLSKAKGLLAKQFSPNHRRGMCPNCWGLGFKSIHLQFLPPVKVTCDVCQGHRLNPISLSVAYKGKNFGHILQMTVAEARPFFDAHPKIVRKLDTLISVGLDYLKLGQDIASLSGGEQQRIRLTKELSKRSTGKTLYLFDEPTVGLHSEDIVKLLKIFHTLVSQGNTLILIEHNLDVIRSADYIIDLGPGPGLSGGTIVATGTPEDVAKAPHSFTGHYLDP